VPECDLEINGWASPLQLWAEMRREQSWTCSSCAHVDLIITQKSLLHMQQKSLSPKHLQETT